MSHRWRTVIGVGVLSAAALVPASVVPARAGQTPGCTARVPSRKATDSCTFRASASATTVAYSASKMASTSRGLVYDCATDATCTTFLLPSTTVLPNTSGTVTLGTAGDYVLVIMNGPGVLTASG